MIYVICLRATTTYQGYSVRNPTLKKYLPTVRKVAGSAIDQPRLEEGKWRHSSTLETDPHSLRGWFLPPTPTPTTQV